MISAERPSCSKALSSFSCRGRRFGSSSKTGRKTEMSGASFAPSPLYSRSLVKVFSSVIFICSNRPRDTNGRYAEWEIHAAQEGALRAEDTPQHAVQCRDVDVVLRSWPEARHSHQRAAQEYRREETYISVGRALNLEPGLLDGAAQLRDAVA